MSFVFGVFAHVDAGKTTFSEQLLYRTHAVRSLGRVDEGTSLLDHDSLERQRGITIYAGESMLSTPWGKCFLIDTPGHVDFAGEAERVLDALDTGIILIGGREGVRAHTKTMFRLLLKRKLPILFFLNKADQPGFDAHALFQELREQVSEDVLFLSGEGEAENRERAAEFLAERDETFLEDYLAGNYEEAALTAGIRRLWNSGACFPVLSGSAKTGEGVDFFLQCLCGLAQAEKLPGPEKDGSENLPCRFQIYKVRHDEKGRKILFGKVLQGCLQPKMSFVIEKDGETVAEKISELRRYSGDRFEPLAKAAAGELAAVLGLQEPGCGWLLQEDAVCGKKEPDYQLVPALCAGVLLPEGMDRSEAGRIFHLLEEEEPQLRVTYEEESSSFQFHVMGAVQMEVLKEQLSRRFGLEADFGPMEVQYRETIGGPVTGWGHFEPLRHYAEVELLLEPGPRGSGITFESRCPLEVLAAPYQSQVKEWGLHWPHRGVLTGALLTDVHMVLMGGRSHLKHTEGGDFREAVRRGVRQGLMKADNVLLEPFYRFEVEVPLGLSGRAMTDIRKMDGVIEDNVQTQDRILLKGRGPVAAFSGYQTEFASYTKGEGSLSLVFDGYDRAEKQAEIVEQKGYAPLLDPDHPVCSVFCKKGAGYPVPWDEAESMMHTKN